MKIKIEDHYRFIVYIMAGHFDQQWAEKFKKRLFFEIEEKSLSRDKRFDVIIDMFGVSGISPAALKVLKEIAETLQKRGIRLALCNPEPEVEREMSGGSAISEKYVFPSIFSAKLELGNVTNE